MNPGFELVMTLLVEIAPALEVGAVGAGYRRVIPITGGSFEGPALRGAVLPGGADWNLTRPDGAAEVWARYTLRLLLRCAMTDAKALHRDLMKALLAYARTTPQFEVADERYAWLRRGIFVGTLVGVDGGGAVQLRFFLVT